MSGSLPLIVEERTTALRSNSVLPVLPVEVIGGEGTTLCIRKRREGGGTDGGRGVNPLMPFRLVPTEEVVGLPAAAPADASFMKKKLLPPSLEEESFSSSSAKKRALLRLVRIDFGDGLDGDDRQMSKADATPMTLMPTMDFPSWLEMARMNARIRRELDMASADRGE